MSIDSQEVRLPMKVSGVSGAAPVFRKSALLAVSQKLEDRYEIFDEDFFAYYDDSDLSARLMWAGYSIRYSPECVGYHARTAAGSPGGFKKVLTFIKHHKKHSSVVRELSFKNQIYFLIKNWPKVYLKLIFYQFLWTIYVAIFETSTLRVIPELLRVIPKMLKKRKFINSIKKISTKEFESRFFVN